MKKLFSILTASILLAGIFSGCTGSTTDNDSTQSEGSSFDTSKPISVISREEGSGTRGAFIELTGIEQKGSDGTKKDMTTKEAIIKDGTDKVLTAVAGDAYAIGYISLGSLNNTVKAFKVGTVEATTANVKNGSYKISRPFNIATKGEPTGLAKDFIDYIMSKEGQEVITNKGFIAIKDDAAAYAGSKPSGKIVVGGSSSVSPVMEKLIEAYKKVNTNATVELQTTDSTSGMTGASDGTLDIGMASRELKDSEKAVLTNKEIALDGIAIIGSTQNTLTDLTVEMIKKIFTGEVELWSEVK